MKRGNMPQRKAEKQKSATERAASYAKLTPKEALERLDKMFGLSVGAKKQREKLVKLGQKAIEKVAKEIGRAHV